MEHAGSTGKIRDMAAQKAEEGTEVKRKRTLRESLLQMDRQKWGVILLLGVLLAVISMPSGGKSIFSQGTHTQEETESTFAVAGNFSESDETEQTVLEQKLESLLSGVEGIGKTRALLMTQESPSEDFYGKATTKVTGVLISAQGADDPAVIQKIKEAIIALFQIEAHKIKVMKMK